MTNDESVRVRLPASAHSSFGIRQYTNQESGYFSIVEGHNGRLYIGAAEYGINAYLLEFDDGTLTP